MSKQRAELPVYGIVVEYDPQYPACGSITWDESLYSVCSHCQQRYCCYECDGSTMNMAASPTLSEGDTEEEVKTRIKTNGAIEAVLSLILAHACAGIDIKSAAYLEGIETAFDAIINEA